MFFWGSYNFQEAAQVDHPDRPPLRYPVYVPPSLSLLRHNHCLRATASSAPSRAVATTTTTTISSSGSTLLSTDAAITSALEDVRHYRMQATQVACGMKHVVAVLHLVPVSQVGEAPPPPPSPPAAALFGMGLNDCGQLGHHVANYSTTFTRLQVEEVMQGSVVGVACGAKHTLICSSTGCVYVSGDNTFGQLGLPPPLLKTTTRGGSYAPSFTQLTSLAHITKVYANQNCSFALDARGQLYSWGETKNGHLGHDDTGERLDPQTLRLVATNTQTPQLIRWFERHRVFVLDVAVGKAHLVCRSEDEVYTCGEAHFGKLGHGNIDPQLLPTRVVFPPRKQVERLVDIAAGDDHTLVLKENPLIGSIVYFFGKLSNADGQLIPLIVPVPTSAPLCHVAAGRGTFSAVVSGDGKIYAWGKHSYAKVYNGTSASAQRPQPTAVEVLTGHKIAGIAAGGTFITAYAAAPHAEAVATQAAAVPRADGDVKVAKLESEEKLSAGNRAGGDSKPEYVEAQDSRWDVVVPHDTRVGRDGIGDPDEVYEEGARCFLRQYLGAALGAVYCSQLPTAPPRTVTPVFQFERVPARQLTPGQKVRLWMTNVYAIGTVAEVIGRKLEAERSSVMEGAAGAADADDDHSLPSPANDKEEVACGTRVKVAWERDDWNSEVVTLYSDDETLASENENRWQPFWFEKAPNSEEYIAKHLR